MSLPQSHFDDPLAGRFHSQINFVGLLIDENRKRMATGKVHWDEWFDRISKLPPHTRAMFPEMEAVVAEIEAAAAEIAKEREKISIVRDDVMLEKIRELACASTSAGLPLGERIAADFAELSAWRKSHLDGIHCDMFLLIERRRPSAKPPRGERRPLFDALFNHWAKSAGIPVKQAEEAALQKRDADIFDTAAEIARRLDDECLHQVHADLKMYGSSSLLGDADHLFASMSRPAAALKAIEVEIEERSCSCSRVL